MNQFQFSSGGTTRYEYQSLENERLQYGILQPFYVRIMKDCKYTCSYFRQNNSINLILTKRFYISQTNRNKISFPSIRRPVHTKTRSINGIGIWSTVANGKWKIFAEIPKQLQITSPLPIKQRCLVLINRLNLTYSVICNLCDSEKQAYLFLALSLCLLWD